MRALASNTRTIRVLLNLFLARFSPTDIERATRHPIRIALCGDQDTIWDFRDMLTEGQVPRDEPFPSLSLHPLPTEDPANAWQVVDDCQLAVVLLQREHLLGDTLHRIQETLPRKVATLWVAVGHVEPWLRYEVTEICGELGIGSFQWIEEFTPQGVQPLLKQIIKHAGGYELTFARKMTLLRDPVCARLVQRAARQNLMIAMASALPGSLPWIGPIIGLVGVTYEIIFLTSYQLRLALQIASVYGREMNLAERIPELVPIVGSAFGWRAVARELIGFVPAIGPAVKGSIAYAGTVAIGEAARWYYKTGQQMEPAERSRILQDAYGRGTGLVRRFGAWLAGLTDRQRRDFVRSLVDGRPALPSWNGGEPPLPAEKARQFSVHAHEDEEAWRDQPETERKEEP